MKAIENEIKDQMKSGGFSKVAKAFAIGAATGMSIGMWLSTEKGKAVKGRVLDFVQDWIEKKRK